MSWTDSLDRSALFDAKSHIPLLPRDHVPRPRLSHALSNALQSRRLVFLTAGAMTGKTTVLADWARTRREEVVHWYTVDDIDESASLLLTGLIQAVGGCRWGICQNSE